MAQSAARRGLPDHTPGASDKDDEHWLGLNDAEKQDLLERFLFLFLFLLFICTRNVYVNAETLVSRFKVKHLSDVIK